MQKKQEKKGLRFWLKKRILKFLVLINILISFFLLLSYLSTFVNPNDFHYLAFLGLSYPILLIVNVLFIIFWILLRSKRAFISIIVILLGWNILFDFIAINIGDKIEETEGVSVKVLSYNVRVFNRWNWLKDNGQAEKALNFIENENANIVCLQEFYSNKKSHNNSFNSITKNSSLKNSHISYVVRKGKTYDYGLATFTNYPIVNKGRIPSDSEANYCIFTDLKIGDEIVRVYNIHLKSIHLGYDDYHLIKNIKNADTIDVNGYKSIYNKMHKGYIKRAQQANLIAASIKKCQHKVILCGDFNDMPISYVYNTLVEDLSDSFCESGNGIGSTYINSLSPFRIDFIFHSKSMKSFEYTTEKVVFSDHYPIHCILKMSSEEDEK